MNFLDFFQVKELEMEIYPVLDELTSAISTLNLERARRFKGHLLALTQRVQKVNYNQITNNILATTYFLNT